jgi:phospho-N-acetylmuramoyl-pentapeptide-transferase
MSRPASGTDKRLTNQRLIPPLVSGLRESGTALPSLGSEHYLAERGFWVNRLGKCFAVESLSGRRDGVHEPSRPLRDFFSFPMLLWLLQCWSPITHVCQAAGSALDKITLRAALAAFVSFLLAVLAGPRCIAWLRDRFREPIKCDSPEIRQLHRTKESTPTMGGLFIVGGLLAGVLFFGDWRNGYLWIAILLALGLMLVGAIDDLIKLRRTANGLSARQKFLAQAIVAVLAVLVLYGKQTAISGGLSISLPWAGIDLPLGGWFIPLAVVVILGSANAVNLTDGLDGLAGGCLISATAAMTALVYAAGHAGWAEYLHIPRVAGAGELTVLGGGMIGGMLGFLWFNCHPAQVFMGDTGSLPLGGLLGYLALVARQELLFVIIAGVFVAEALSVILQVSYYRWRKRRIFRCAPLHHHFQLQGWAENQIVVRFWIAAALCALLGVTSLKLNIREDGPVNRHIAPDAVARRIEDSPFR